MLVHCWWECRLVQSLWKTLEREREKKKEVGRELHEHRQQCGDGQGKGMLEGGGRGYGGINGDERRPVVMHTQFRIQMMGCGIVHLEPV